MTLPRGGGFVVPDHGHHGQVLVAVRPSSVLVSTSRPDGASARNTWPGTVVGLSLLTDRVRLDIDATPTGARRRDAGQRRGARAGAGA